MGWEAFGGGIIGGTRGGAVGPAFPRGGADDEAT